MSANSFNQFRKNLAVSNQDNISTSYAEITKRLNKDYWDSKSETANSLQVGSYGRQTAIKDVSDLDMVFELPLEVYERLSKVHGNGPSQLLQEIRDSVNVRYPKTEIKGDGQVVVVSFGNYVVEILPAFRQEDGAYRYGDTNDGGSWDNYCRPREEISAVNNVNNRCNRNLKRVTKMLRAWKNTHGAPMSGMLIDTLVHNFFKANTKYDDKSYASYPELMRDVFTFLANQPEQSFWLAPGSGSRVDSKGKFQRKAKKSAAKAQEALDADTDKAKHRHWKEIFGRLFPSATQGAVAKSESYGARKPTEEFIEDKFPVDIQYDLEVKYDVMYQGGREAEIRAMENIFPWLRIGRGLEFSVVECNVPKPFGVFWKVRNVGPEAERRSQIRGEIAVDGGRMQVREKTSFAGPHFVECYVVKDGICVARDKVEVRIKLD